MKIPPSRFIFTSPADPRRAASRLVTTAALAAALLGGCSAIGDVMQGEKVNYKTAGGAKAPSLDVPPDLTQLTRDTRYAVPGAAVSANSYQVGQAQASSRSTPSAALNIGDVRIERAGSQRWLVINRPADKLWEPVREFWLEAGFLLAQEQESLGIMETQYAENRAKLPQDFIRNAIGKVFDSLYSTGERDKFRRAGKRIGLIYWLVSAHALHCPAFGCARLNRFQSLQHFHRKTADITRTGIRAIFVFADDFLICREAG